MSLAEKIAALLEGFTRRQIEGLTPNARRPPRDLVHFRVAGPLARRAGDGQPG
jgi:hypothetical protein